MEEGLECQRRLLPSDYSKVLKWEEIWEIIEKDDDQGLLQLEFFARRVQQLEQETQNQETPELVKLLCPIDSKPLQTALHKAIEKPAPKCLKVLLGLSLGPDVVDLPDVDGNTPLHYAVKELNSDAITNLIDAKANVNLRNDEGDSPLHLLAYAAATAPSGENFEKCADALLKCPSLDIEALNNSKFTPLQAVASKMTSNSGSLVTFYQMLVQKGANIDSCTRINLNEHSVNTIHTESTPLQQPQTATAKLLNQLIRSTADMSLLESIADVFMGVSDAQKAAAANCHIGSKKILYYMVDLCSETGVKSILQAGADPWFSDRNGELALHRALTRGHVAIVNLLINEMKKNNNSKRIDLRQKSFSLLQNVLEYNEALVNESCDPKKCLQRLFENDILIDVNQKEKGAVLNQEVEESFINQTALHIAGAVKNQDAMAILLEHGAYLGEHRTIGKKDYGTVLKSLIAKTLEKTMDNCIKVRSIEQTNDHDHDYTLEMNYHFLMKPSSTKSTEFQQIANEVSPLNDVSQSQEQHNSINSTPSEPTDIQQLDNEVSLLYDVCQSQEHRNSIKHPLIQIFLYAKWKKMFPIYIVYLVLYTLFVILLTVFMCKLKKLRVLENLASTSNSSETQQLEEDILRHRNTLTAPMAFVLIITI
ncbi:hypothetical protein HAZT_HAZT009524 [Hyalella azteca]|uniref:Uncharacterized protein n=1 Tax=Hyalella azteca TaxID=294128 RepID=A0A6A0GSJ9_HYAAZ|nr:hypothetical protein HAZT_HAZT009524 [Hyalella azteca]